MDKDRNLGGAAVRESLGDRRGAADGGPLRALRPLLTESDRTSRSKGFSKGFSKADPAMCFRRACGGVLDGFLMRGRPHGHWSRFNPRSVRHLDVRPSLDGYLIGGTARHPSPSLCFTDAEADA